MKEVFWRSDFSGKIALVLSTWFGIGLFPVVPGTLGTLGAIPFVILLIDLGVLYKTLIFVIFAAIAVWVSGRTQDLLKDHDPSAVVIDEVAGFFLTMFFLPFSWLTLVLGFILFRFFDILKPYPIKRLERLKGGFGIVMDDLLAGLYAYAGVRIVLLFV
ncbi:MAG: phosphatidylglycerophosphatase A [Deltaproteobacteria bacterium]|nr:phosphatidylglycerophosphatase A [Deltaproteobacteria bacterium]MBW2116872.1 phosphatidylglycerophosphatase A [Deltaproteobacteria bacterium]MBW2344332.1 phosphatidylglycerophosphatase A [Deltaproteobacteria bacterium]